MVCSAAILALLSTFLCILSISQSLAVPEPLIQANAFWVRVPLQASQLLQLLLCLELPILFLVQQ